MLVKNVESKNTGLTTLRFLNLAEARFHGTTERCCARDFSRVVGITTQDLWVVNMWNRR